MGSPPEDDPGANEGASDTPHVHRLPSASDRPSGDLAAINHPQNGDLAARIDALILRDDEPDASESLPGASLDLDELDEVVDSPPIFESALAKLPTRATTATPPPIPRVVAPPRLPQVATLRSLIGVRPPGVPRAASTGPIPVIAIPPPEHDADDVDPSGQSEANEYAAAPVDSIDIELGSDPHSEVSADLSEGGVEVGTETPNVVVDQPLEAHLESPTVVDRALDELRDAGGEPRAASMLKELEATADVATAAFLAYELGEHYERRLADEARAVKAYGRALTLDPSLRSNLWAIRRVFYRRGLWPNLVKLIAAEVAYARDDLERADLLLEQARVASGHLADFADARAALDEAVRIAPGHQGALLELERIVARARDVPALLDVWERLAEAVEYPARKVSYWLEVGRTAAASDYRRAQEAFERAAALATGEVASGIGERVARDTLRIAEQHGAPGDIAAAIEAVSAFLLSAFGPAGPGESPIATDRGAAIRRELVALRRRQAQLARAESPETAWDVLQQALALVPGEPLVLADLTELAEELGRYDDLAELVASWQAVEGDPGRAMALSIRRADALLRGGQHDRARALLASLEATAPGFIVLTSAGERDALARTNPGDLAKTYLAAAHAAVLGSWLGPGQLPSPDVGTAAALYVQAAELLAYEVGGTEALDEARAALGKALEAVPGYPVAIEALTELDDATGQVASALARLSAAARDAPAETRRAFSERAIRLARGHGDFAAVLELERAIVAAAPAGGDRDALAARWRLESTLAQLGRDDERAQLLTEIGAAETDPTRRGSALLTAARLRERAGSVGPATDLYRQVLAIWPQDAFARESLVDLLRSQERWPELVAERRAEARLVPDGPALRRALREAAWVLEVQLEDAASAAQVYDDWLSRIPDDRTALEGAARCRAEFGDRLGEVVARRAIADLDPSAETHWMLGRALERAGQFDEAADVFRMLANRSDGSVAATSAAFGLADLAAGRADTAMRVDATVALATRTTEPRLGAALAEDSGWMYALVLEDFDHAAQSFASAIALDPNRRGALLGAALVAARRGDAIDSAWSYDVLAACVEMPDAAAALHLRAAAAAAASGDVDLANQRVVAARSASPDDTSALLVIAETSATPNVEPNELAATDTSSIDRLLDRAEVLEMRAALADDPTARASWELDRAEALELAGRLREAGCVVASVIKAEPGDVRALEAMRRMAKRTGDQRVWAQASYQLARVIGDPAAKLGLLRDAASVLDTSTPDAGERALAIYKRILEVEPGAPEHERLLELMRERADVRGLIATLTERLTWLDAGGEPPSLATDGPMVPLLLERATVLHGLGDSAGAMADLDTLLERSARHAEALRFRADLALHAGEVQLAVQLWQRYLAAETRPQRRAEIELELAKVLAEDVNDVAGAIENLERVVEASPEDVVLRERLLGLCLRVNDWARAARELRVLARLRPTPQDRAREELRLGVMLRDRLDNRTAARLSLDRARSLDPLNLDAVREISEMLDVASRTQALAAAANSLRGAIAHNPKLGSLYDRLATVTGWQSEVDARWLALVGVESLGTPSIDQRQVLEQGRQKIGVPTRRKLDLPSRAAIRGAALGPLVELWHAIAPAVQIATGVDAAKLGFHRGDKIPVKKLVGPYEATAIALACFGIEEVDVYISAARPGVARALAAETPILCLGVDVASARIPHQRWLLGRAVATLAEGFATLLDLRDSELGWTLAAALRAVELAIPPGLAEEAVGDEPSIAERARLIKKEISRKAKTVVQQLVQQRGAELVDVARLRRNALAVGHRAGLLWSGDLSVALAQLDVGKGGKSLIDSAPALELTGWSIGEDHVRLRETLGVGLKGAR